MEGFLASFALVAVAEIGDKTQLLSFVLAARYPGKAGQIITGILIATVANHLLAAFAGSMVDSLIIPPGWSRWVIGLAFLGFAVWALIPDSLDESDGQARRLGAFAATTTLFFVAEMGDKTQLVTVALGAQYPDLFVITAGTTLGMLAANVPAVLIGERLARRWALDKVRFVAAGLFAVFALLILLGVEIDLSWIAG